uniref:Uncharacterized protein n=1 Tax=Oryza glumipatula TaxID=40148 RepID=A0A0E0ARB4_9ORYZ
MMTCEQGQSGKFQGGTKARVGPLDDANTFEGWREEAYRTDISHIDSDGALLTTFPLQREETYPVSINKRLYN